MVSKLLLNKFGVINSSSILFLFNRRNFNDHVFWELKLFSVICMHTFAWFLKTFMNYFVLVVEKIESLFTSFDDQSRLVVEPIYALINHLNDACIFVQIIDLRFKLFKINVLNWFDEIVVAVFADFHLLVFTKCGINIDSALSAVAVFRDYFILEFFCSFFFFLFKLFLFSVRNSFEHSLVKKFLVASCCDSFQGKLFWVWFDHRQLRG